MSEPIAPPPPPVGPPPGSPPPVGPPPAGPPPGSPPGYGGPPPIPPSANADSVVQGPAIGLIVTGGIGILFGSLGLLMNVLGVGMAGMSDMMGEFGEFEDLAQMTSGAIGILSGLIGLAISGLIVWAGLQMMKLRQWTLALVASILAMIPCIGPCCVIGIPIGIWCLIILLKPEIKSAFHS